jgi:hypothetical protein
VEWPLDRADWHIAKASQIGHADMLYSIGRE